MKERPIYPYAHEVRAILDGRKTQTRRVVKPQPFKPDPSRPSYFPFQPDDWVWCANSWSSTISNSPEGPAGWSKHCPYGQPGDRLWVRETWGLRSYTDQTDWHRSSVRGADDGLLGQWRVEYAADFGPQQDACHWRPSIHMPRWASRITLEIVNAPQLMRCGWWSFGG